MSFTLRSCPTFDSTQSIPSPRFPLPLRAECDHLVENISERFDSKGARMGSISNKYRLYRQESRNGGGRCSISFRSRFFSFSVCLFASFSALLARSLAFPGGDLSRLRETRGWLVLSCYRAGDALHLHFSQAASVHKLNPYILSVTQIG